MKTWEDSLNTFLKTWQNKKEVIGALLCGSHVTGTATKFSDIDIHIILSDKVNWRERGNKVVDGHLIEYFANPAKQIRKYFEENYKNNSRSDARMFTVGKILFDKKGEAKKLQEEAKKQIKRAFKKPTKLQIEFAKYSLWDNLDNLKDLADQNSPNYKIFYYINLQNAIRTYGKFLGVEVCATTKLSKFLNDDDFKKRYSIEGFKDKKFVALANACLVDDSLAKSLKNTEKLIGYVQQKMGGFNIDGWKVRTKVDGK
jgi:predicted nucleotidyltransferase